ncbi:MAG: NAD(P)H-hydrate dehydratase [Oscillospiraceae bacterium]|nr:NAD(P)H-hydrate dehydratase [Oscillospiraceae bacterium]
MERTDKNIVKRAVPNRPDNANKGTMGTLLSICGSFGMAGAAILAGKSALRCGVGLEKLAIPKSIYPIAAVSILESVFLPLGETSDGKISRTNIPRLLLEAKKSTAVLLGCGLSVCDDTKALVKSFVENCTAPMVLDADALNCIAENPGILKKRKSDIIITPHPGEMGRLCGITAKEVNADRVDVALSFAKKYGVITVLKGSGTIIASPNGQALLNTTGNSGMATGGSGDVLAGMTAGLLAQGKSAFDCAAAAVYLHGLAGNLAAEKLGKISMLPSDIIDYIAQAFKSSGL